MASEKPSRSGATYLDQLLEVVDRPEPGGWKGVAYDLAQTPVGKAALKVIDVVDTPRAAIVAVGKQLDSGQQFNWDQAWADASRNIGYGEVVEQNHPDWAPWQKIAWGFAGDLVLDPTNYIGFGAVKSGIKGAVKGAGVDAGRSPADIAALTADEIRALLPSVLSDANVSASLGAGASETVTRAPVQSYAYLASAASTIVTTVSDPVALPVSNSSIPQSAVVRNYASVRDSTTNTLVSTSGLSLQLDASYYTESTPTKVTARVYDASNTLIATTTTEVGYYTYTLNGKIYGYLWTPVSNWSGQVNLGNVGPGTYRIEVEIRDDAPAALSRVVDPAEPCACP